VSGFGSAARRTAFWPFTASPDLKALAFEPRAEARSDHRVVVGDEDA
jgi:hypothetical protein